MPGLAPFAPAIAGLVMGGAGMVDANVQNKAAIKNSENAAASAQAQVKQNQGAAFGNLNAFNQANPGLTGQAKQPAFSGATSVPLVGQPGQQQQMSGQNMNPQQIAALMQAMKGGGGVA